MTHTQGLEFMNCRIITKATLANRTSEESRFLINSL